MAVRFSALGQTIFKTTNLPPITNFTMMGWVKLSVDRNAISTIFKFGRSQAVEQPFRSYLLQANTDGTTLLIYNGLTFTTGSSLTVDTWTHLAMTVTGTGTGQYLMYYNGVLNITWDGHTNPLQGEIRLADWEDGGGFEPFNGCIEGLLVYDVALTQQEIYRQSKQIAPVRLSSLNTFLPFRTLSGAEYNRGGGNETWTVAGSITEEAGPRVPYVWVRQRYYFVPGGAVITPLSLSSSVTPVTQVVKRVNKSIASSSTPASSVVKRVSKGLSSSVTPVSTVVKGVNKSLSSVVVPVSGVVKVISKRLSSVGLVTTSLTRFVVKGAFTSVVVPVTGVVKVVVKSLNSAVTPISSVVTSAIKVMSFSSSVSPVSSLVKVVNKGLSSSVPVTTGLVKVCSKVIVSVVTPVTQVVKRVNKSLLSGVIPTTTFMGSAIKMLVLSSIVNPVSSLSKVVVKSLSSVVVPVSSVRKVMSKAFGSVAVPTTTLVKSYVQYVVLDSFVTPVTGIITQYISGSGLPSFRSMLPKWRRRNR